MSTTVITYDFYNKSSPKCRACKFWDAGEIRSLAYYGDCTNKDSKIKNKKDRPNNSKACNCFRVYEGLL